MNKSEFLSQFERHLLIGEPKRGEVVAELNQHLSELEAGADPINELGYPQKLARKLNHTHIGLLSRPWLLYALPLMGCIMVYSFSLLTRFFELRWELSGQMFPRIVEYFPFGILIGLSALLTAFLGRSLIHMNCIVGRIFILSLVFIASGTLISSLLNYFTMRDPYWLDALLTDNKIYHFIPNEFLHVYQVNVSDMVVNDFRLICGALITFILGVALFILSARPYRFRNYGFGSMRVMVENIIALLAVAGLYWLTFSSYGLRLGTAIAFPQTYISWLVESRSGLTIFLAEIAITVPIILYFYFRIRLASQLLESETNNIHE